VTYIGGKITNNGDKTVTAARVEATFWSAMNEVAQKERADLRILKKNGVYEDAWNSPPRRWLRASRLSSKWLSSTSPRNGTRLPGYQGAAALPRNSWRWK